MLTVLLYAITYLFIFAMGIVVGYVATCDEIH